MIYCVSGELGLRPEFESSGVADSVLSVKQVSAVP